MPTKSDTPTVEVRRDEDGLFVHYGIVSEGAFHPIGSERAGDYDERVKAAQDEDKE